jgi:hypothetical protein
LETSATAARLIAKPGRFFHPIKRLAPQPAEVNIVSLHAIFDSEHLTAIMRAKFSPY